MTFSNVCFYDLGGSRSTLGGIGLFVSQKVIEVSLSSVTSGASQVDLVRGHSKIFSSDPCAVNNNNNNNNN